MAKKFKIDKTAYDLLDDAAKADYIAKGDGFVLDVEGAEGEDDIKALKAALDRVRLEAKEASDKLKAEEEAKAERERQAQEDKAKKSGDIAALEASWKAKLDALELKYKGDIDKSQGQLKKILRDNEALKIATEISAYPDLILPHILSRIEVDFDGETPVQRVLDPVGKLSASTLDDLKKELVANPKYAAIIIGSKGSGAGGQQSHNGGAGTKKPSEMTSNDRAELFRTNPAEFERLFGVTA